MTPADHVTTLVPGAESGGCGVSGRLSDSQFNCLWALSLGSKGAASNARTLQSLLRRGLAMQWMHQGELIWETTARGEMVIEQDGRAS